MSVHNPTSSLLGEDRSNTSMHTTRLRKRGKKQSKYCQNNMDGSLSDGELHYSYFEESLDSFDSDDSDYSDNDENSLLHVPPKKSTENNDEISGVVISSIDDGSIEMDEIDGSSEAIPAISSDVMNKFGKKVRNRKSSDVRRSPGLQQKPNTIQARAIFSYKATNPRELSINVGDIITVTDKSDLDWWSGYLPNGDQGIFPSNYVAIIKDDKKQRKVKKDNALSRFFCNKGEDDEDFRKHLLCRCCPENNDIVLHKMFLYFLLCGVK